MISEAYLSCPEVGSANFEGDGWSGYTTTNNTGLSWIRSDHQMGRNRPAADVTYRNSSGKYWVVIYILCTTIFYKKERAYSIQCPSHYFSPLPAAHGIP